MVGELGRGFVRGVEGRSKLCGVGGGSRESNVKEGTRDVECNCFRSVHLP